MERRCHCEVERESGANGDHDGPADRPPGLAYLFPQPGDTGATGVREHLGRPTEITRRKRSKGLDHHAGGTRNAEHYQDPTDTAVKHP